MSTTYQIPGVYRRPTTRVASFPRVRTDVAGFVGVAGPRHVGETIAVDDWKSYVAEFRLDDDDVPIDAPPGSALDSAVRDFFANGGQRCWIVNVAERLDSDPDRAQALLNIMLGIGESLEPHGLELLLCQDEVSIVVLPELDAERAIREDRYEEADAPRNPCFKPCSMLGSTAPPPSQRASAVESFGRLYSDDNKMWAQRYLISRLLRTRWRWFAILSPPAGLTADQAVDWRRRLTKGSDEADVAGLYWPWVLAQDSPGSPVETRSPVGTVAGIFSRVDATDGPHVAPANEPVLGAVGLESAVGDEENSVVYEAGVNVLRAFPSHGIQIWGARTLLWRDRMSRGDALAFVNARRTLSAIARSAEVIGRPLVFEPNTPWLRIRFHQLMTDYLIRVFEAGALKGNAPEEAFFVSVETVESSPEGHLECKIGVALAAPAEFIVFRLGRRDGVVELSEAAWPHRWCSIRS